MTDHPTCPNPDCQASPLATQHCASPTCTWWACTHCRGLYDQHGHYTPPTERWRPR